MRNRQRALCHLFVFLIALFQSVAWGAASNSSASQSDRTVWRAPYLTSRTGASGTTGALETTSGPRAHPPFALASRQGTPAATSPSPWRASIIPKEELPQYIAVLGDVPRPGPIPYVETLTPTDYLLLAGLTHEALTTIQGDLLHLDGTSEPLTEQSVLQGGDKLVIQALEQPPERVYERPPITEEEERGVRIMGAVNRPRRVPFDPRLTIQDYIERAGGIAEDAEPDAIRVWRLDGALVLASDVTHLRPGDAILVPGRPPSAGPQPAFSGPEARPGTSPSIVEQAGPEAPTAPFTAETTQRIWVTGDVVRRMAFQYESTLSASDYIRLAGGVTPSADAERAFLIRSDGSTAPSSSTVQPGDIIVVPRAQAAPVLGLTEEDVDRQRQLEAEAQRQAIQEQSATLQRFGTAFFRPARERIRRLEEQIQQLELPAEEPSESGAKTSPESTSQTDKTSGQTTKPSLPAGLSRSAIIKDAITGFVGPADLLNADALTHIPHQRIIETGDELRVIFWAASTNEEPKTLSLVVSPEGEVILPQYGKLVVRGMSLEQFEEAVRDLLARTTYQDLRVVTTFARLQTIQVSIVGNAFRPGSYAMSAVATLFNALYMSGGPDEFGSLRDITLKRGNQTIRIDFYRYLLNGDASQDVPLQDGDLIFIGVAGREVAVTGEVRRPAIYELAPDEGLARLLEIAGGIRPSGLAKTIQIDSVRDNAERIMRTLDATGSLADAPPLLDGDRVMIYPVLSEPVNTLRVTGYVKHPRVYEWKEGLRVRDAIELAGGLRDEAYLKQADLFRQNPDGRTYTLLPIDLKAALDGDPDANLPLQADDRLTVYSKFEVSWHAVRLVGAQGAVVRPGNYVRADGMRVSDLLRLAGGVRPEAYAQRALLLRLDTRNRLAISVPVNLETLDGSSDPALQDGDVLLVFTEDEARWEPDRVVRVSGAVQSPGLVQYTDDMRVSDALLRAGGALPDHAPIALLLRKGPRWDKVTISVMVNLDNVLAGESEADIVLQPEDELTVYHIPEVEWEPAQEVSVQGAVQRGDTYPRTEGMRISDLLFRAGGVLPNAYLERAYLSRYLEDYERLQLIPVNLAHVLGGDESEDLLLQDGDTLRVSTLREAEYMPDNIVTIAGAVQRPDVYTRMENMRLMDLIQLAGGVLPGARDTISVARTDESGETQILRTSYQAAQAGDENANLLIEDGDVVSVVRRNPYYETARIVTIEGEVRYPGAYAIEGDERISDLIARAGGLTERADPNSTVFLRKPDDIINDVQRQGISELWQTIEQTNDLEFERALARARIEAQRQGADVQSLTESIASVGGPLAGVVGAVIPSETGGTGGTTAPSSSPATSATGAASDTGTVMVTPGIGAPTSSITNLIEGTEGGTTEVSSPRVINLVTPARRIPRLAQFNRIVLNLPDILANEDSPQNLPLKDGDVLRIEERRPIVAVDGAVTRPGVFAFRAKEKVKDYIRRAGGLSADADADQIYVLRSNGEAFRAEEIKEVRAGDTILVPTRVMVETISSPWDRIASILRFTVTVAATTLLFSAIIKR